jgi:hypothetical protein
VGLSPACCLESSLNWFLFFQIDEDLKEENAKKLLNQEIDVDKPGNAQFYCLHCA